MHDFITDSIAKLKACNPLPDGVTLDDLSARKLRHRVQHEAMHIVGLTQGIEGIDKEDQVALAEAMLDLNTELTKLIGALRTKLLDRDFEAHKAEKEAAQAKAETEAEAAENANIALAKLLDQLDNIVDVSSLTGPITTEAEKDDDAADYNDKS